ncbi:NADH-ubiquinone oxidoreductase-F iron-sulfur binding region domain-containing protein, partial [Sphingobacterium daejeonense]|uniref:NADH-ubiquinone oxidoreductase-F iron-sulfur binding region domain-containing protein n=1 Tax=Sphingobacterium daejeonense TaxID=371142 RepID=UPI003D3169A6
EIYETVSWARDVYKRQGWMEKILEKIEYGRGDMSDIDLLWQVQQKIEGNTVCPFGGACLL